MPEQVRTIDFKWLCPEQGWLKSSIRMGSTSPGYAGYGVVLRDERGHMKLITQGSAIQEGGRDQTH